MNETLPTLLSAVTGAVHKWQAFLWLGVILFFAIGFNFQTPGQRFTRIDQKIDTLQKAEAQHKASVDSTVSGLKDRSDRQELYLRALIRLQCYKETGKLVQLSGLPCSEVGVAP